MPNWMDTSVSIDGPEDQIARFRANHIVKDEDANDTLDFQTIIPMPASLRETEATGGDSQNDWYYWQLDNWGCKWGCSNFAWEGDRRTSFSMRTAWSFPEPIFRKLAERYPTLEFHCMFEDYLNNIRGAKTYRRA